MYCWYRGWKARGATLRKGRVCRVWSSCRGHWWWCSRLAWSPTTLLLVLLAVSLKQMGIDHDSVFCFSCFSISDNIHDWLLLYCIPYFLGGVGICFVSQMWCSEPLHGEQLFYFYFSCVHIWSTDFDAEWIRKKI